MTEPRLSVQQKRARILQEMGEISHLIRGKLSVQTYATKGRSQGPYYLLQRWEAGKNKCQRVSSELLPVIQQGVSGFARFEQLADEFIRLSEAQTWEAQPAAFKKKFQKFWPPTCPIPGPSSNKSANK